MLEFGKRKLIVTLIYTIGVLVSCGLLVWYDKIDGSEFVQGLYATGFVVGAMLGANVAKGFMDRRNE